MDRNDDEETGTYPAPPDLERVRELRTRMRTDKAEREAESGGLGSRLNRRAGKTAKDIGTYTLIPSLMIAGPLVGYGLGYFVEKQFDITPWGLVGGILLGVLAGFRQVILLLQRKNEVPPERD